jgi:DNA primase
MDECSVREAAIRLQARFPISAVSLRGSAAGSEHIEGNPPSAGTAEHEDIRANKPLTFTLTGIDPTHPYLRNRGISAGTARQFGTGFFPGSGSMAGRIVIPIYDEAGRRVASAGRSVDGAKPRYRFPAGFMKSAILFNLHRVSSNEVVVVEGFFDCLNVWQAGVQNVVALMGSSLSTHQERLLSRFERIILFLDGDDAGVQATRVIADRLVRSRFVRAVEIAAGRQPDELSSEEIRALLQS